MKRIKEFIGYSGCRLYLYRSGSNYFVRKYSKNKKYNDRLKKQIEKQSYIYNLNSKSVRTPAIFNVGIENGLLFFDMEYVMGQNALYYVIDRDYKDVGEILDKIFSVIISFKNEKKDSDMNFYEESYKKVSDIFEKIKIGAVYRKMIFEKLRIFIDVSVPTSFCHGDLTFENIIINQNKNIFLIDTLDNYFGSRWLDIAKLYQNIETDSYNINHHDLHLPIAKKEFILHLLAAFCKKWEPYYARGHSTLLMLIFLRMLPYAKNLGEFNEIFKRVVYYLEKDTY